MEGSLSVELAGQRLLLLPERAIYWPDRRTLLVADLHLGKAATFRAAGIPAPEGVTGATLSRLSSLLLKTQAEQVVVLGDLVHAASGLTDEVCAAVSQWRDSHSQVRLTLVTGNHDRRAGCLPDTWNLTFAGASMEMAPFTLLHHPEPAASSYALAGHLHPGIHLRGAGGHRLKLPCFWFGSTVGVLPAFGDFTGLHLVRPKGKEQAYAVAGDAVLPVRTWRNFARDLGLNRSR